MATSRLTPAPLGVTMGTIGQILAPATVPAGATFEVRVLDSGGAPLNEFDPLSIDINGQPGPHQFLQFPATGRHSILVVARDGSDAIVDSRSQDVQVVGPSVLFGTESGPAFPILHAIADLEVPYQFTLKVGTPLPERHPEFGAMPEVSADRRYYWQLSDDDGAPVITTTVPWLRHDFLWDIDHARRWSTRVITCRIEPEDIVVRRTLSLTSAPYLIRQRGFAVPMVRNDATVQVGEGTFTCIAYVHNVGGTPISLDSRSVTPIGIGTEDEIPASYVGLGQQLVFEPRSVGVVIVQMRGGVDVPWAATGVNIRFAGRSDDGLPVRISAVFDLPLRPRELPHRLDIDDPALWPWNEIENDLNGEQHEGPSLAPFTIDRVTGTIAGSTAPTPDALAQLTELAEAAARAMRVPFEDKVLGGGGVPGASLVLAAASTGDPAGSMTVMSDECNPVMPPSGPVAEGEVCDPDNIGDPDLATADANTLTCALTKEFICATRPGRWVNARKGDVVLSPSDKWSLVADVLASVKPSQPYSHSGIMTRNYDEITHSTASEDWMLEHLTDGGILSDGTDGLQPQALHYIWPGVVAQSTQGSIEGEPYVAPDNGKTYQISSFSPASGTASAFGYVPALVVKPDPVLEAPDPSIRAALHSVANGVRDYAARPASNGTPARNSKSHYRFYCFTDARLSETEIVPAGSGWASGTFPSVCSVLIWRELRKHNLKMEGPAPVVSQADLELEDTLAGAEVAPGTLDGLYHYTADERRAAGRILFNKIYAKVYEKAGWFGEALTDASDDTANQVVNAFANDDVNGKDSDAWETTGDADGVSPANILFWDGPDRGGVYGFAEPAVYRPPRLERYRLSKWRKFEANGQVTGTVTRPGGMPVEHATVQIVDSRIGGTDAAGHYTIANVPYFLPEGAEYTLTAAVVVDRELYTATKIVVVNGPTIVADIILDAPPTSHRRLTVVASVVGGDDEDWPDDDESYSRTNGPEYVELSKESPFQVLGTGRDPTFRWGGEVRVEHYVDFGLLPGAAVAVGVKGWLYEGTSESTHDLNGEGGVVRKVIGVDQTDSVKLRMENTDDDEPDTFSELTLTITNDAYS